MDSKEKEVRYKYSPTHSEPAVCCVPNYTRNLSYYLDQMWGKTENGLAALLYAPSNLTTSIGGTELTVEQVTNYPYSDVIEFKLSLSQPTAFALYFRKPNWSNNLKFKGEKPILENDFYKISKTWKTGDVVSLQFDNSVKAQEFRNGEIYFQRGALVYALDIPHLQKNIKDYPLEGFYDYYCLAKNDDYIHLKLGKNDLDFAFVAGENLYLEGNALDTETQTNKTIQLTPMGKTVLRRVTFPIR